MRFSIFCFFLVITSGFAHAEQKHPILSLETAKLLAELPLHCIETEYPNKLGQVLTDATFLDSPANLHPIFYGCFDWHSSVHGHWLLASLLRQFPETDLASRITALFNKQFTSEKVAAELAYFEPKLEKSFERTYGWAWLLKLQQALILCPQPEAKTWTENLEPLVHFVVESYYTFLPKLLYPIRVGEHSNTAFGLSLALDYARTAGNTDLARVIEQRAKDYFLDDVECPISWEPSGYDFISPCLEEAELMSKVLEQTEYEMWLKKFLPQLFKKNFTLEPGKVSDRTDGKLVHLDGLNFSRARCFFSLALVLPDYSEKFLTLGDAHLQASAGYVTGSDYMGSHWLASFLVYAYEKREAVRIVETTK